MKTKTASLIELWIESRTRFTHQLEILTENDLQKNWEVLPIQLDF